MIDGGDSEQKEEGRVTYWVIALSYIKYPSY